MHHSLAQSPAPDNGNSLPAVENAGGAIFRKFSWEGFSTSTGRGCMRSHKNPAKLIGTPDRVR